MPASIGRLAVQRFRWSQLQKNAAKIVATNSDQPFTLPNPFVPKFDSAAARWRKPKYSLRQQAVLVKQAKAAGLLHLLPPGPKADQHDTQPAITSPDTDKSTQSDGPRMIWSENFITRRTLGSNVGARFYVNRKRLFKGHKWERTMASRRAKTRVRLRDMDKRIHRYRMKPIRVFKVPTVADPKFYLRTRTRQKSF